MLLPTEIHRCTFRSRSTADTITRFSQKMNYSLNSERGIFIGNLSLNQLLEGHYCGNSVNIIIEYFFHLPQVKITIDYTHRLCGLSLPSKCQNQRAKSFLQTEGRKVHISRSFTCMVEPSRNNKISEALSRLRSE